MLRKNQSGQSALKIIMIASIVVSLVIFAAVFIINVQKKTRDSERITKIIGLQKAIDLYFDTFSKWPKGDDDGDGWDEGFHSDSDRRFIQPLVDHSFMNVTSSDPKFFGARSFKYAVYAAGSYGCPYTKGSYYVLGISELENDTRPPRENTGSGFACLQRDWGKEFDYVTGKFSNE